MLKIFDDLNKYISKENEIEQKEILKVYGMDIKDVKKSSGLKRGRNIKESIIINILYGNYF